MINRSGNAPNPFNPSTTLFCGLPEDGPITVTIHDLSGRRVRTLVAGSRAAGRHQIRWDGIDDRGRRLAAGVYFVRLQQKTERETRKIVIAR